MPVNTSRINLLIGGALNPLDYDLLSDNYKIKVSVYNGFDSEKIIGKATNFRKTDGKIKFDIEITEPITDVNLNRLKERKCVICKKDISHMRPTRILCKKKECKLKKQQKYFKELNKNRIRYRDKIDLRTRKKTPKKTKQIIKEPVDRRCLNCNKDINNIGRSRKYCKEDDCNLEQIRAYGRKRRDERWKIK